MAHVEMAITEKKKLSVPVDSLTILANAAPSTSSKKKKMKPKKKKKPEKVESLSNDAAATSTIRLSSSSARIDAICDQLTLRCVFCDDENIFHF